VFFGRRIEEIEVRRGDSVDVAFVPQINEFRGRRSVQLVVTDVRPARRESGREKLEEFFGGGDIAPEDAYMVLPERSDFVSLWRRLKSGDRPHKAAGKEYVCLRVFQELGLIKLHETEENTEIQVSAGEQKVDLGSSAILKRLTEAV
jgi:single-stranded-DNA-specific exonuclease